MGAQLPHGEAFDAGPDQESRGSAAQEFPDFIEGEEHHDDAALPEPGGSRDSVLRIANEFATVEVWPVEVNGDTCLMVLDVRHKRWVQLDPLVLESVTRLDTEDFGRLVDPSFAGIAETER